MKKAFLLIFTFLSCVVAVIPAKAFEGGPIVFVIDSSGSMKGEKIDNVKKAVEIVISNLRPELPIAILSFNTKVTQELPATTDRALAQDALSRIQAAGRTALYDAIDSASSALGEMKPSRIIVLSDGGDTKSKIALETLLEIVQPRGIPIDLIGLDVKPKVQKEIAKISEVTKGGYYQLDQVDNLIQVYQEILKRELVNISDAAKPSDLQIKTNRGLEIALALISSTLGLWLLLIIFRELRQKKLSEARLFALQKYAFKTSKNTASRIRQAITSYSFIPDSIEKYIRAQLELIHFKYKYETVVRWLLIIWFTGLIFISIVFRNIFIGLVISFLVPPVIFKVGSNNQYEKQKKAFDDELPEMLNVVASGLNAGLGLQQSLEAFAGDSQGEVARQLRRAIGEIRVGTPTDEALMAVADRMKSEDLKWAVTALSIQRLVGGSMSTILRTAYETIRSRNEIRREVRTLSAEGKLSATVLMIMPIAIFLFLLVTRREYVQVFWTEPLGIFLVFMITIGMSVGWAWMKKIVDIKI